MKTSIIIARFEYAGIHRRYLSLLGLAFCQKSAKDISAQGHKVMVTVTITLKSVGDQTPPSQYKVTSVRLSLLLAWVEFYGI